MTTRSTYNGASRKLIIAFDVGTTYSGVSYSILDPGRVPEIKGVTRFPAQERVGGNSKIPTILYYDKSGKVRAAGAEATREEVLENAEDHGWVKAEWFKMHMRPKTVATTDIVKSLPCLPLDKTVVDVFADFMKYLYDCTKKYIHETHIGGEHFWGTLEHTIEYVLSHPNGWEGAQQAQMRQAAIQAGLVPSSQEGHKRVHFVTEGEASLHFCIEKERGLTTEAMKNGRGILITDAGGGTIDISAYRQTSSKKGHSFEEIAAPECLLQGSIFVTKRAEEHLRTLLGNSKFSGDIENIRDSFDKNTKLTFRNIQDPQFIKFGGVRDKDPKLNIRGGQLRLPGSDVAKFFEPSIASIVKATKEQVQTSHHAIHSMFLVGGFAANDWLFARLKSLLEPLGISTYRPDSHINKAVADGAVSFYLDHHVATRVSRVTYGSYCYTLYDPSKVGHKDRAASVYTCPITGEQRLYGNFSTILPKNTQVSETHEFREHFWRNSPDKSTLNKISGTIECYRGSLGLAEYQWVDHNPGMYSTLCKIEADTSDISRSLKPRKSAATHKNYYQLEYDIILSFGLTELKAEIAWIEDGEEERGPATIIYETPVGTD